LGGSGARRCDVTGFEFTIRPRAGKNVLRVRMRQVVLFLALSAPLAAACGRRATEGDCQLIVNKSVELQMREMSRADSPSIEKREREVRAQLGEEIKSCEGRHVTERTLSCVRAASSPQGLDACLR
jgi:hypothetical protein